MEVAPLDYGPVVLSMPFGFPLAADTLPSGCPCGRSATVGASPWLYPSFPTSCPHRVLHGCVPQPTRHYPRLWIGHPSSGRPRDLNPPDQDTAQHTLRAPPPPHAARPVPRGRPVEGHAPSPPGVSRGAWISVYRHAVVITPVARWGLIASGTAYSTRFPSPQRRRPSPSKCEVGVHIGRFEACSTFTRVTACRLAESPSDPSVSKAPTVSSPPPPLR